MFSFEPGHSFAHRLDPRTKLLFQIGFIVIIFAHTTPTGLAMLSVLALGSLAVAGVNPIHALWSVRYLVPILLVAPLLSAITIGSPWFIVEAAIEPALASYRVILVVLVSAGYVRTTPVRDSRAAIQWAIPGRMGAFLGIGVALVFRFFPVIRRDLVTARDAMLARLGDRRPVTDQIMVVASGGLRRSFSHADQLALALQSRCFAWNPTQPELRFTRRDLPILLVSLVLFLLVIL